MKILFKSMLAAMCLCSPLVFAADAVQPAADTKEGSVDYTWEGKVDDLRIPQGEIVVDDMMFNFSTNTLITKKGKQTPLPIGEVKVGSHVRVIPILPIPEMGTRRAQHIEILQ